MNHIRLVAGLGGQAQALTADHSAVETETAVGASGLIFAGSLGLALAALGLLRTRRVR